MKKALFLSHVPITPVVGGDRIRIFQTLRLLASRFQVDVVCITHSRGHREPLSKSISGICSEKYFYIPLLKRCFNAAKTFFNAAPEMVNHYRHGKVRRYIDSIAGNYDVIVCGSATMAGYFFHTSADNVYVDFTDSFTLNLDHAAAVSGGLAKIWHKINAKRMRVYERKCRETFRKVAYISCRDRDYIGADAGNTCILKNSVAMPAEVDCCRHTPDSKSIVFVGKMDYAPNIEACCYFVNEVLPAVAQSCPDVRFIIVGMSPTAKVERLAKDNGHVTVTGKVESVADYYRNAAVVVAPMISGSGLQNKILEAMAHGCCVVTTPVGADGLESEAHGLIVAGDSALMAQNCIKLLNDHNLGKSLGDKNKKYVRETYSYEATAGQFDDFIG